MKKTTKLLAAISIAFAVASPSHAALYTNTFGVDSGSPSDCDDCSSGPWGFSGAGQSINFFGTSYANLFVGSNGYLTFGAGISNFTSQPLNTQSLAPMIAGSFTDLDSRNDAASNVFINNSVAGQIVATWQQMGHFAENYSVRSTFQIVVRSDQFAIGAGEGQIGFFYDTITDPSSTSAGFGDGLAAVNVGEVAFHTLSDGTALSDNAPRWFNLNNGAPEVVSIPEPGSMALTCLALVGLAGARRRKAQKKA